METPLSVAQITRDFLRSQVFLRTDPFTPKKKPKKEVDYFWKHQTSNSRLRHSIGHSIPFRKNVLLRITYFRIPDVPGLYFVPWHRVRGCLGAADQVTGAAADEYNLNVVDCNASVTVAFSMPSISVSA